jgi:hypothetical protein
MNDETDQPPLDDEQRHWLRLALKRYPKAFKPGSAHDDMDLVLNSWDTCISLVELGLLEIVKNEAGESFFRATDKARGMRPPP